MVHCFVRLAAITPPESNLAALIIATTIVIDYYFLVIEFSIPLSEEVSMLAATVASLFQMYFVRRLIMNSLRDY